MLALGSIFDRDIPNSGYVRGIPIWGVGLCAQLNRNPPNNSS
jgi:hypothetical protein